MKFNYFYEFKCTGKMLKSIRASKELSQLELAELCDLSDSHIRNIENGSAHASLDALVKICNALDIPFERLITNTSAEKSLSLSQIDIINGLDEEQQISCIEILNSFKHQKRGNEF